MAFIVKLTEFPVTMDKAHEAPKKLGTSHLDKDLMDAHNAKRQLGYHTIFKTYNPVGDVKMDLDE